MFTKNQLVELFKGIVYYTNDHKTFFNIALVCKDFAQICKEYSPMKMNEYRRKIKFTYIDKTGYYLPNGLRHDIIFREEDGIDYCRVFYKGVYSIFNYKYCSKNHGKYVEIYKNDNKFYEYFLNNNNLSISVNDKSLITILHMESCLLCNHYHDFNISTPDAGDYYHIYFDCLTKKFHVNTKEKYISHMQRRIIKRNKIIRKVIDYSKMQAIEKVNLH